MDLTQHPRMPLLFFLKSTQYLLSLRTSNCNPKNFNNTQSSLGWVFYPTRMLPDFSINIAGKNQSVMFFDAATCASVVGTIDVLQDVVFFLVLFL